MSKYVSYTRLGLEQMCQKFAREAIQDAMKRFEVRGTADEIHYLRALEAVASFRVASFDKHEED